MYVFIYLRNTDRIARMYCTSILTHTYVYIYAEPIDNNAPIYYFTFPSKVDHRVYDAIVILYLTRTNRLPLMFVKIITTVNLLIVLAMIYTIRTYDII